MAWIIQHFDSKYFLQMKNDPDRWSRRWQDPKWRRARASIITTPSEFLKLPKGLQEDDCLAKHAIFGQPPFVLHRGEPACLKQASNDIRSNKELVTEVVKARAWALSSASEELRRDKEFVLKCLESHGCALRHCDSSFCKNKEIVLTAVKQDGFAFQYAAEEFRRDKNIILEAAALNADAFFFADDDLKAEYSFVKEVVKVQGTAIQHADESLKRHDEIVMLACRHDGLALQYCPEFHRHRDIVKTATGNNPSALRFAENDCVSFELIYKWGQHKGTEATDKAPAKPGKPIEGKIAEICKEKHITPQDWRRGFQEGFNSIQGHSTDKATGKKKIYVPVMPDDPDPQTDDAMFVKEQYKICDTSKQKKEPVKSDFPLTVKGFREGMIDHPGFMKECCVLQGLALAFASEKVRANEDIVLTAIRGNRESGTCPEALGFADEALKHDRDFIMQAVEEEGTCLKHASSWIKSDLYVVQAAIQNNPSAFEFADEALRGDSKVAEMAVSKDGLMLQFASEDLRSNPKVVQVAVDQNPAAAQFADLEHGGAALG